MEPTFAYTIRCLACNAVDPIPTDSPVPSTVISAMAAKKKTQIQAWSDEPIECNHTKNVVDSTYHLTVTKHCTDCELTTNLWMCLSCGSVGCGRAQWDGTGGNGHAMQHFQSTQHPITVKLGTIEIEGESTKGDVYCYLCDDMRLCPSLSSLLPRFGIDRPEKYERSMTELQLEHNQNFDFVMHDSEGRDFPLATGAGHLGLHNLGNSCYMGSVMQCLLSLPLFEERFKRGGDGHIETCQADPPNCIQCQLFKLVRAKAVGQSVHPWMFKAIASSGNAEFSSSRQQDAMEFMSHLMNTLARVDRTTGCKDLACFEFKTQECFTCTTCDASKCTAVTKSSSLLLNLSATLNNHPDLVRFVQSNESSRPITRIEFNDCLEDVFAQEIVELDCERCGSRKQAKGMALISCPSYLVIQLGRFTLRNWIPTKLDDVHVTGCMQLDLKPFIKEPRQVESEKASPNGELVRQLLEMGFPLSQCRDAACRCTNLDQAMNYILSLSPVDPDSVLILTSAGFDEASAINALRSTEGNVERAFDYLLSRPDQKSDTLEGDSTEGDQTAHTKYRLCSFISHRGPSVHCGHYIAHILDSNNRWVLCNDDRLAYVDDIATVEDASSKAYILFYRREN